MRFIHPAGADRIRRLARGRVGHRLVGYVTRGGTYVIASTVPPRRYDLVAVLPAPGGGHQLVQLAPGWEAAALIRALREVLGDGVQG